MSTQDITVDFFSYYFWLSIALYIGLFWVLKSIAYRPFMSKEDRDSPEVHLIDKIMIGIIALSSITLLILYLFFYHPDKERIMRIYGTSEEKKSRSSPIEKREDVDDNTISVDDFQKGKVWLRNYLQVGLESLTTMRDTKYLTNKLQFTVINGFEKEKSNSQNIVIEVENLSLPKADNIRVILNLMCPQSLEQTL